ncbi:MAG: hypothetical protein HPY65_17515 [Syntrophaceae bacterium]|nr:hypothetical protein [Syntrophaceae bacterium]
MMISSFRWLSFMAKKPCRGSRPKTGKTLTLRGGNVVTFKSSQIFRKAVQEEQPGI